MGTRPTTYELLQSFRDENREDHRRIEVRLGELETREVQRTATERTIRAVLVFLAAAAGAVGGWFTTGGN